jgi:hypothetical protein
MGIVSRDMDTEMPFARAARLAAQAAQLLAAASARVSTEEGGVALSAGLQSEAAGAARLARDLGAEAKAAEVDFVVQHEQACGPRRRRFGPFPGGNPAGIDTAEAAYEAGYRVGLHWQGDYVPGGPYVHAYRGVNGPTTREYPEEYRAYCIATAENHREWLRGWHEGRAKVRM